MGAVGIVIAISVASIRLAAQSGQRFDAELGAAVLRQTGVPLRTAPTLGGVWAWEGARTAVRADGVIAAGSGDWAGQLAARAAYFALDPDAPLELGGEVRAARVAGFAGSTQLVANVRRHLTSGGVLRPTRGIWAGGVGGVTVGGATVGGAGRATAVYGVEAGGWRAISAATRALATMSWTASHADSLALVRAGTASPFDAFAPGASRVRTTDATATIEHVAPRIELTGSAGVRHAAVSAGALANARVRWGTVAIGAVTWWLRPGVGAVVTAGTHPADPARALPAVQHVAFTLRIRPGRVVARRAPSPHRARTPARGRSTHRARARFAPDDRPSLRRAVGRGHRRWPRAAGARTRRDTCADSRRRDRVAAGRPRAQRRGRVDARARVAVGRASGGAPHRRRAVDAARQHPRHRRRVWRTRRTAGRAVTRRVHSG